MVTGAEARWNRRRALCHPTQPVPRTAPSAWLEVVTPATIAGMDTLTPRATVFTNLAIYYAGWSACVLGAAHGRWGLGALTCLALLGVHLLLSDRRAADLRLLVLVTTVGYTVDSVQTAAGLLIFAGGQPLPWLAPLWIGALWMLFSATLRFALQGLAPYPLAAAALGALGGPAAFWAGHELGAVSFHPAPAVSLAVLAAVWAVLLPSLLRLATVAAHPDPGAYRAKIGPD